MPPRGRFFQAKVDLAKAGLPCKEQGRRNLVDEDRGAGEGVAAVNDGNLGSGRIVASEIEAPNLLANVV